MNLHGAFLGIRAAPPVLARSGDGAIVNVSSVAGFAAYPERGADGIAKWVLRGLTRSAAVELAPLGFRVNTLAPGAVRTAIVTEPDAPSRWDAIPAGRVGEVDEIAEAALFLISPARSTAPTWSSTIAHRPDDVVEIQPSAC